MKWQISELFGMSVYSDKAVFLGKVEDVVLDVTNKKISGLALSNVNKDVIDTKNFQGVIIPYRIVKEIGDIIIVRHIREQRPSHPLLNYSHHASPQMQIPRLSHAGVRARLTPREKANSCRAAAFIPSSFFCACVGETPSSKRSFWAYPFI